MMAPGKITKPRQIGQEAKQEEEQEKVKGHQDPRRLKLGEWKLTYIIKEGKGESIRIVKRLGEESRAIASKWEVVK